MQSESGWCDRQQKDTFHVKVVGVTYLGKRIQSPVLSIQSDVLTIAPLHSTPPLIRE